MSLRHFSSFLPSYKSSSSCYEALNKTRVRHYFFWSYTKLFGRVLDSIWMNYPRIKLTFVFNSRNCYAFWLNWGVSLRPTLSKLCCFARSHSVVCPEILSEGVPKFIGSRQQFLDWNLDIAAVHICLIKFAHEVINDALKQMNGLIVAETLCNRVGGN